MRKLIFAAVLLLTSTAHAADVARPLGADTAPATQALGALNATCVVATSAQESVGFQLAAGTLIGTIVPEVSYDNGTTWVASYFDDPVAGNKTASIVFGSSNTATARTIVGAGGAGQFRVRVSAYTSGTANCLIRASMINDPTVLYSGATNATIPPTVANVGGEAETGAQPTAASAGNLRQIVVSTDGAQYVRLGGSVLWSCALNGIAATLTQCQAAPAAGLSLYITGLYVQTTTTTSGTYALQYGTGTNCATGTTALFPSSGTSNRFNAPITSNAMASIFFPVPIKVPAANALCLIGVATNTISAQIVGFTAP